MSDFNASGPRSTLIAVRALPTGPMMAGALLVGALLIHGVSPAEAADRRGQPSVVATGAATARSATAAIATPFRTIVQSLNQLKESAARSRGAHRKGRKTRRASALPFSDAPAESARKTARTQGSNSPRTPKTASRQARAGAHPSARRRARRQKSGWHHAD